MISLRQLCFFVGALLLVALPVYSQQDRDFLAERRAAHLLHGINTGGWFAQSPNDYTVPRLQTHTTLQDIVLIKQLGFDHIRLSIDAEPLQSALRRPDTDSGFLAELDRVVDAALAQKLAIVIDIHPEGRYKATLLQGTEPVQRFALLWRSVAAHFASRDPELVFFEIMNEPEQPDTYRWQGIQAFIADQIRGAAPKHTIIATGGRWAGLDDLLQLEPLADPNVIYTFHDYEPFAFTHQGATWTDPNVQPLRGVPYPSTPENVAKNVEQEPTAAGQFFVQQYGLAQWNAARVDTTLAVAEKWSQLHHVPLYCGEFGVHRPFADNGSRGAWLRDMRVSLQRHHIGWAMWDYQDNFGAVVKHDGQTTPDPVVMDALGLQSPK